jgi:hypothetical protein
LALHELLGEPASDSANDDGCDPADLLLFDCFLLAGGQSYPTIYPIRVGQRPPLDPHDLMRPFLAGLMRMWPISTRVNKPENDDPSIVDPIELATDVV